MSTKEPPGNSNNRSLIALSSDQLASALGLGALHMRKKRIAKRRLSRTHPLPASAPRDAIFQDLFDHSREVMHIVGTVDFWMNTRIQAQRWSNSGGLPAVTIDLGVSRQGTLIQGQTLAINANTYTQSTAALKSSLGIGITADQQDEIMSQWGAPQLTLLIALGMDEAPSRYEYTCIVADIVVAVASVAAHRIKQATLVPRPYQEPFKSSPGIDIREELKVGYSAFPAGHAFVCAALAEVLASLCEASDVDRSWLRGLAASIGANRVATGLHNQIEVDEGLKLGAAVGASMVEAVNDLSTYGPWAAIYAKATTEWMANVQA